MHTVLSQKRKVGAHLKLTGGRTLKKRHCGNQQVYLQHPKKGGRSIKTVFVFRYQNHMFKYQWKRVQVLADTFWARWQKEYLNMLQSRQKWQLIRPNMKEGDIVLLKDKQLKRNEWPTGVIVKALPSKDGLVRKVEVKVTHNKSNKTFLRPISECILLLSPGD